MTATLSMDALIKRINRKLRDRGEVLRRARPFYYRGRPMFNSNTGEFYIVDTDVNAIVTSNVDPEDLARELGVLSEDETLSAE